MQYRAASNSNSCDSFRRKAIDSIISDSPLVDQEFVMEGAVSVQSLP
jgi:hypothetical protein